MLPRFVTPFLVSALILIPSQRLAADEPTSTEKTDKAPSTHKIPTTDIINGKVEKISDTSITLKVTYQTGGNKPGSKPNPKNKPRTVVKSMTFQLGEIPPVKVVTDGPKPTRTTGSFSDVKVGDEVMMGTGQVSTKSADGKTSTQTKVTGIDVLKHSGASTTNTTPTPKKTDKN